MGERDAHAADHVAGRRRPAPRSNRLIPGRRGMLPEDHQRELTGEHTDEHSRAAGTAGGADDPAGGRERTDQDLGRVGLDRLRGRPPAVAYLAVRVALGAGGKADKTGALQTIAEQPAGRFFLWVLTVGLVALTIWQLAEAGWGHGYRRPRRKRTVQRLVSLGEAGVAGALAYSSFKVASGKGGKSKGRRQPSRTRPRLAGGRAVASRSSASASWPSRCTWSTEGSPSASSTTSTWPGAEPHARDAAIRFGQVGWPASGSPTGSSGCCWSTRRSPTTPRRPPAWTPP